MVIWKFEEFMGASIDWYSTLFNFEGRGLIIYPVIVRIHDEIDHGRVVAEFVKRGFLQKFEAGPQCPNLQDGMRAGERLRVRIEDAGTYRREWPVVRASRV